MKNNFVIFIITHGRPNNVKTYSTLKKSGYTGQIYLVIDNEDKTINQYQINYGTKNIKIFDKKRIADLTDEFNNFDNRRTTTHARNACFDIANELGFKYFLVLDDDYTSFEYRYLSIDNKKLLVVKITNLDTILNLYLKFFIKSNFKSIAFAQGGDFIGGAQNSYAIKKPLLRKCMNSFFCSTDRRYWFVGQLNEDVNTYVSLGNKGELFGTIPMISLVQMATQNNKGGMTDAYNLAGTYIKSFYTVLTHPSGVKVSMMHSNNPRIHHLISWKNTTPMIISEKFKK